MQKSLSEALIHLINTLEMNPKKLPKRKHMINDGGKWDSALYISRLNDYYKYHKDLTQASIWLELSKIYPDSFEEDISELLERYGYKIGYVITYPHDELAQDIRKRRQNR